MTRDEKLRALIEEMDRDDEGLSVNWVRRQLSRVLETPAEPVLSEEERRVVDCARRLVNAYETDGNGVGVRSCEDSLIAAVNALPTQPEPKPSEEQRPRDALDHKTLQIEHPANALAAKALEAEGVTVKRSPSRFIPAQPEPIEAERLVLHCPACGKQHLDVLESDGVDWSKKPHRKHLCKNTPEGPNTGCGHLWRPKETNTVGVLRPEPSEAEREARARLGRFLSTHPGYSYDVTLDGLFILKWHDCVESSGRGATWEESCHAALDAAGAER